MFVLSFLSCFVLATASAKRPIVRTQFGLVKGFEMKTYLGRTIYSFYNIPYTESASSTKRFEELGDPKPWKRILDASGPPVVCSQVSLYDKYLGQEDCLILHVYTPEVSKRRYLPDRLLPVIVYIHGGAYYFGSGSIYGPRYLLDRDVVLIGINYRLGVTGFGSTGDHMLPGNLGMKDQLMALKWIQKNAIYFGGDKKSVTLLGISSGAACVHLLSFSKYTAGLIHRMVLMGGTALSPWAISRNPFPVLEHVSFKLGCPTNSTFDMIFCLERVPIDVLTSSIRTVQLQVNFPPVSPFKPVVDELTSDSLLSEYPYTSIRAKRAANIPILMSDVKLDGLFPGAALWENKEVLKGIDENWFTVAPAFLELKDVVSEGLMNYTLRQIRNEYFHKSAIKDSQMSLLQLISDREYLEENGKAAALISRYNPHVYYYVFDYLGGMTTSEKIAHNTKYGVASHIDDTFYIFNVTDSHKLEKNATDLMMIQRMTTMLYTFASTGIPSVHPIVEFLPVRRNTSIYGPLQSLVIKTPDVMEMTYLENWGNIRFWESLPLATSSSYILKKKNGQLATPNSVNTSGNGSN